MNYNRTYHKEAYLYMKETNSFNMYYQWKILVCVCVCVFAYTYETEIQHIL